jgi:protein-S-isoprenylcysteine O-methyltransferase Ste14
MLSFVPLVLFLLVTLATLIRGQSVRARTGVSAFAFLEARGLQRIAGFAFGLAITALVAASLLLALGRLAAPPAALAAGSALMGLGALAVLVAQRQMGDAWRIGVRAGDAPLFVTRGLFAFSRNPIFAGMIAMAIGDALAVATAWGWAAAIVFALACHVQVRLEEAHLAARFGTAYADFRRAVPRWLLR